MVVSETVKMEKESEGVWNGRRWDQVRCERRVDLMGFSRDRPEGRKQDR